DKLVTGVQTCALPILRADLMRAPREQRDIDRARAVAGRDHDEARVRDPSDGGGQLGREASPIAVGAPMPGAQFELGAAVLRRIRSEERRVGKECRWGV